MVVSLIGENETSYHCSNHCGRIPSVSLTFPFDVLEKVRGIQLKQLSGFYENILVQKNDRTIIIIAQKEKRIKYHKEKGPSIFKRSNLVSK